MSATVKARHTIDQGLALENESIGQVVEVTEHRRRGINGEEVSYSAEFLLACAEGAYSQIICFNARSVIELVVTANQFFSIYGVL